MKTNQMYIMLSNNFIIFKKIGKVDKIPVRRFLTNQKQNLKNHIFDISSLRRNVQRKIFTNVMFVKNRYGLSGFCG